MKLVNQQLIKNTNLKLLYNSVLKIGGFPRAAPGQTDRPEPDGRFRADR